MKLPPLQEGRLIRRYKRFLADVELAGGDVVTAHCPNPGSMASCMREGGKVMLSHADVPRRKLSWTWELSRMGRAWVLVNTARVNAVAAEGLEQGRVPALEGYAELLREVTYGEGTRFDFRLEDPDRCWVEVKSVTLEHEGASYFPDAVSLRGQKHLVELARAARAGERAVLLFLVGRGDTEVVRPAALIDPDYAEALAWAAEQGVEVLAHRLRVATNTVTVADPLSVEVTGAPPGPLPKGRANPNRPRGTWKAWRGRSP